MHVLMCASHHYSRVPAAKHVEGMVVSLTFLWEEHQVHRRHARVAPEKQGLFYPMLNGRILRSTQCLCHALSPLQA